MAEIKYKIITPDDNENIKQIADWYLSEWNIPIQTTIEKTKNFQLIFIVKPNLSIAIKATKASINRT